MVVERPLFRRQSRACDFELLPPRIREDEQPILAAHDEGLVQMKLQRLLDVLRRHAPFKRKEPIDYADQLLVAKSAGRFEQRYRDKEAVERLLRLLDAGINVVEGVGDKF